MAHEGGPALDVRAGIRFDEQELEALRDPRSPRWGAWSAYLRGVARGRFGLSGADAEDAVQSALLKVSSRLDAIRDPRALLAYMLKALLNEARQLIRRDVRRPPHAPLDTPPSPGHRPLADTVADPHTSPEDELHHAERRTLVRAELERICAARRHPERDLRIALRVLLEECKSGDVARELGVPPQTVYNVTHRILEALAQRVEEL
jgi:RNA polymerase sigma factor (sigma-70 family)